VNLDKNYTQFCTCQEHFVSSSLIIASYHDLIGFIKEIANTSSFVGFWDFGDSYFICGSLPLSLDLDSKGIMTCFGGIL